MSAVDYEGGVACPGCAMAPAMAERARGQALGGGEEVQIVLPGVHCAACISTVEGGLLALDGVTAARVNLTRRRVRIRHDGSRTVEDLIGAIGAAVEDPRKGRFALTGIAEALAGGVAEDLKVWAFGAALHAAHRQVEVAVEVDVAPAGHGSLQAGKGDREPLEAAATAHQRITQELGGEQAGDGILAAEQQIHIAVVVDVGPGG